MELFNQALMIMILGMGLVFAFLFLVIQGLKLVARIIHHFEGEPREEQVQPAAASAEAAALQAALIAVALEVSKSNTRQHI